MPGKVSDIPSNKTPIQEFSWHQICKGTWCMNATTKGDYGILRYPINQSLLTFGFIHTLLIENIAMHKKQPTYRVQQEKLKKGGQDVVTWMQRYL